MIVLIVDVYHYKKRPINNSTLKHNYLCQATSAIIIQYDRFLLFCRQENLFQRILSKLRAYQPCEETRHVC